MFKKILYDNIFYGLLIGLFTPIIGCLFFYFWKIYPHTIAEFVHYLSLEKQLLKSMTVVCLLMNVAVFTLFVNTKKDQTAKGIFLTTIIYAIFSLVAQLVR